MKKAVFLDRDGVLNREIGTYVYKPSDFIIEDGVGKALRLLKDAGYLLIVITNQGGIAKGLYTSQEVWACHNYLQAETGNLIDDLYFCPYHESATRSLMRKPDSLMLEKAIAKYDIAPHLSWMVGDAERDMQAAKKVGVRGIFVPGFKAESSTTALHTAASLLHSAELILSTDFATPT